MKRDAGFFLLMILGDTSQSKNPPGADASKVDWENGFPPELTPYMIRGGNDNRYSYSNARIPRIKMLDTSL